MRLIDADELMEHVWRDKLDSRELIAEMIENAPTIKRITDINNKKGNNMVIKKQEKLGVQWKLNFNNAPLNTFLRIKFEYKLLKDIYQYEVVAKIIDYNEKEDYIKLELAPNTVEYIAQKVWYAENLIAWSEE